MKYLENECFNKYILSLIKVQVFGQSEEFELHATWIVCHPDIKSRRITFFGFFYEDNLNVQ